ncbi:serine/threonine protein kinase, partial [Candidatus Woesearchaeota archaeon]|nr:serine/threonine protein kinase [Candidatus Woesearchaeota archaeon]
HLLVVEPNPLRVIHGYSLLEKLGQGSFATAYRAVKEGREYCVREQGIHGLDGRSAVKAIELFRREADVLSGLDHPQIPKVYDYFEETADGWRFYLVQDLVSGRCLKSIINPPGENGGELARPFEEEKVVDVALQLCSILGYLHGRTPPVVHRDVKPSNVMMDETGKMYLIDFGNVQQELTNVIGGSTMFGTPGFAPLELCVPGRTTTKSDLYMLGTTMLNLASGIDPVHLMDHLRRVDYKGKFRFKNPSLEVLVKCRTDC